jgi:DNA polymerase-3 subunit beta
LDETKQENEPMKVSTREIRSELTWVQRFVEKKITIPILSKCAMASANGKLTLMGTDLDIAGITSVACQGDGDISVAAPLRQLVKFLNGCKDGYVELTQPPSEEKPRKVKKAVVRAGEDPGEVEIPAARKLILTTASGSATFECMSLESYPVMPAPPNPTVELNGLTTTIPKVLISVSFEESRFTLNGASLEVKGETGRLISTNGHQMSVVPVNCKVTGEPVKTLISKKALLEASKINGGHVLFGEGKDHQLFLTGKRSIIARKLIGTFPDWQRVIPKDSPHKITIDPAEAVQVVSQVAKFADSRSRALRLTFKAGDIIQVFANTVEAGSAEADLSCKWESSQDVTMECGYNADYLLNFLKLADGPVTIHLKDPQSAMMMTNGGAQYVVMPMRLG